MNLHNLRPGESTVRSSMLGALAVRTQKEVAERLGIPKSSVQKLERVALRKIRQAMAPVYIKYKMEL